MFTVETEETIHNLRLALTERQQGKLNGVLNSLGVDALVSLRCIPIDEDGEQTHIGTRAQGRIDRQRTPILTGQAVGILRHLIDTVLLLDSPFYLAADIRGSITDETDASLSI